ncbi:uncharacterized protein KZ484_021130 [Pholidichthys leucotaenia]
MTMTVDTGQQTLKEYTYKDDEEYKRKPSLRNKLDGASPRKTSIILFGKKVQLKNIVGNIILNSKDFVNTSNDFECRERNSFNIIKVPNFLDGEWLFHNDQNVIDLMALTYPGPNLFLLVIDSENRQEEKVVAQIKHLQNTFGEDITSNLVVTLPDIESLFSLDYLKEKFHIELTMANKTLSEDCKEWCSGRNPFLYKYKIYSELVVLKRKEALEENRNTRPHHPRHHQQQHQISDTDHRFADLSLFLKEPACEDPVTSTASDAETQSHRKGISWKKAAKNNKERPVTSIFPGGDNTSLSTSQQATTMETAPKNQNSAKQNYLKSINRYAHGEEFKGSDHKFLPLSAYRIEPAPEPPLTVVKNNTQQPVSSIFQGEDNTSLFTSQEATTRELALQQHNGRYHKFPPLSAYRIEPAPETLVTDVNETGKSSSKHSIKKKKSSYKGITRKKSGKANKQEHVSSIFPGEDKTNLSLPQQAITTELTPKHPNVPPRITIFTPSA